MKSKACLFLAALLLVILTVLPAAGEQSTDEYTVGSFSYRIPSTWRTDDAEDGYYHYAGDPADAGKGYVYAALQTFEGVTIRSETEARFFLANVANGMIESTEGESKVLSTYDIELGGLYASLVRMDLDYYGTTYPASSVMILDGGEIFIIMYLDTDHTTEEQLKIFSDIVNSIEISK